MASVLIMRKRDIDVGMAARLVATQFPKWADLEITPVKLNGSNNTTFRLGEGMTVRLPTHEAYAPQVDKEQRWLPVLSPHLPLPIPQPLARGRPDRLFPLPWSIYKWIEGDTASIERVEDLSTFATALAEFLSALHGVDASQGPAAGEHNFFRGGALRTYEVQTRDAIGLLAGEIDVGAAARVWESALASSWDRAGVWVHGDVAPSNLLVVDGMLRAVLDFGCAAVGDPACDLVMAWTFFTGESRAAFRSALELDDATWARGRGWALWKALITLAGEKRRGMDADDTVRRFGWRTGARGLIDAVLLDHGDPT